MNLNLKLILILVLSSLAVMFVAQNIAPVNIGFLSWQTTMSSALLMFFALTAGFVLGWFVHAYLLHRKSRNDKGELVYLR